MCGELGQGAGRGVACKVAEGESKEGEGPAGKWKRALDGVPWAVIISSQRACDKCTKSGQRMAEPTTWSQISRLPMALARLPQPQTGSTLNTTININTAEISRRRTC